jgi:hypothetical protein
MAFKGQDNSIPAFNSHHHAGSQLTVNSGEFKSSSSRSEILTVVSDGQADGIINSHAVDGAVTSHPKPPTQVEVASADKDSNDSMGVLSCLSGGILSSRVVDGKIPTQVEVNSRVVDGKIPTQVEAASESLDRNAILISNNEFISSKYISNAILQWISENQCVADIRSMGEIISGKSDMAISISADDVES